MDRVQLRGAIDRGFAWSVLLNYLDDAGTQVTLTDYTPAATVVNEFGESVSGFTFEKGTFGDYHLRLSVAEGNTISGNRLTFTLRLNSSGDDVLLGQLVVGVN